MKNINQTRAASVGLKARLAAGTALPLLIALGGMPLTATDVLADSSYCSATNIGLTECSSSGVTAVTTDPNQPSSLTVDSGGDTIGDVSFTQSNGSSGSGSMSLEITGDTTIVTPETMAAAGVIVGNADGDVRAEFGSRVSITNLGTLNIYRKGVYLLTGKGNVDLVTGATIEAGENAIHAQSFDGNVSIENTGTLISREGSGIQAENGSTGPSTVRITNTGRVDARKDAISATNTGGAVLVANEIDGSVETTIGNGIVADARGGNATVLNDGFIASMGGSGIVARSDTDNVLVKNDGLVTSLSDFSAGIEARALNGTVHVVNSGAVMGHDGILSLFGNTTIENSGVIQGMTETGGSAIRLANGNHSLVLKEGSAIVGDIVAGGKLAIDAQTDVTIAYAILDGGYMPNFAAMASPMNGLSLTKKGEGVLTLSGDNTYSGGTTIEAGVLQVSKDANLGGAGNPIVYGFASAAASSAPLGGITLAGGTLRYLAGFDSARTLTVEAAGGTIDTNGRNASLSGLVLGSGNLNKTGLGTLALTGNGSGYGGTLSINQGTIALVGGSLGGKIDIKKNGSLLVGDGRVDGHLLADTTNNGTLVFNQTGNYNYTGDLDGNGALVKKGSGELRLSGEYRYTGSTVVQGGSVLLEAGLSQETDLVIDGGTFDLSGRDQTVAGLSGRSGSLLLGNGNLVVDQGEGSTFGGAINGSGTFTKIGAGRLDLTGNSPFTGGTFVNGGTLAVNGSLSGSNVTVNNGGTLGGNGTVGGIVAGNGGIVAPGNSIGNLKVSGDVTFGLGSIYVVETNAAGQADRIDATGKATISGGTVRVLAENGSYNPTTNYTILTAGDGVTGTFAGVTSNLAFLTPSLAYGANDVILTLIRKGTGGGDTPVRFSDVAVTRNQFNTAEAVEDLGAGNGVFDAVVGQSVPGARLAFDSLSGEIHAGVAGTLIEDSRLMRDVLLNRLGGIYGTETGQWGFWGQGLGSWGQSDRTDNAGQLDRSTAGFLIGLDGDVMAAGNAWRLGIAGGYTSTSVDLDARTSSAEIDSYHVAIYGGTHFGNLGVRGGAAYTWSQVDAKRSVAFPGFSDTLSEKYDARTAQVFGEVGYRFDLGGFAIEPIAGLAYVNVDVDGFRENGGVAALTSLGGSQDVTYSTLGARFSTDFVASGDTTLSAKGMLGWRHAFGDVTPSSLLAFGSAGNPFTVSSLPIATDALVMEAGLGMEIGSNATVSVSYGGQFARKVQDHSIRAGLEVRF
ncbi:autotransporter domain-containing protein [Microvirga sp. TS319]|uniref:autotransporter domain-containing protein n=1 Tax=Microvirga sp. TS319 TaxID=3241165 RepID=UPI00351A05CE